MEEEDLVLALEVLKPDGIDGPWVSVAMRGFGFLFRWPWWIELGFVILVWDLWFWIELGGHGFFTTKFICDLYGGRGNEFWFFFI